MPLAFDAHVELLIDAGVALRSAEPEPAFSERSARTLERLGIRSEHWIEALRDYRRRIFTMVGCGHQITVCSARTDRLQAKGSAWASRVLRNCA